MIDDNERYVVEDYNNCLTIRFDTKNKIPDLKYCENILGYSQEKTGLYISLVPNTDRAVIKMTDKKSAFRKPFIKNATGWITNFKTGNTATSNLIVTLTYKGFGKGHLSIGGLEPDKSYWVKGNALTDKISVLITDSKGVLLIKDIQNGNLELLYK